MGSETLSDETSDRSTIFNYLGGLIAMMKVINDAHKTIKEFTVCDCGEHFTLYMYTENNISYVDYGLCEFCGKHHNLEHIALTKL